MTINIKSLIWILISILIIAMLVLIFNGIDNQKKFNQYETIYFTIQNSEYPQRFSSLIQDFSISDTSSIRNIKENLGLLEDDYSDISYSEIYIKGDNCYYRISSNQYYNNTKLISEIKYFPKEVAKFVEYLDNTLNPSTDSLYSLSNHNSKLELMIKLDIGYLRFVHFRN